jgi:hypothetical protein
MSKMMHLNYIVDRCSFNPTGYESDELHKTRGSLDIHTVVRRKNSSAVTFMAKFRLESLVRKRLDRFASLAMSLSVRFEDLDFDYDEIVSTDSCSGASDVRASQLTMQIPANMDKSLRNPFLRPEKTLKIAEDIETRSTNGVPYFPICP